MTKHNKIPNSKEETKKWLNLKEIKFRKIRQE